jgi:hypothetical protein
MPLQLWNSDQWELIVRPDGTAMMIEPGWWHQEYLCDPEQALMDRFEKECEDD